MPYALCPMPYALCPMPYALCPVVPHMRARKAICKFLALDLASRISLEQIHANRPKNQKN